MKIFVLAVVIGTLSLMPAPLSAQADGRSVAGAAAGSLPPGATLGAIPVSSVELGTGVLIEPDGSAAGSFHAVLYGSVFGQPRDLVLEGRITQGTASPDGSATFSGTGTLDVGDGLPPVTLAYLQVAVGATSLVLSIDAATLPVQLTAGAVSIE